MRKKGMGKRILSALLAFALTVSAMPAGQLVTFAAPAVDVDTTATNVATVQSHAEALLKNEANVKDDYSLGGFTWDSTGLTGEKAGWKYYNGMMLDAYTMLGSNLSSKKDEYFQYVKDFYDKGNLDTDGTPLTYNDGVLGSVPMGLALFDLLNESGDEDTTTSTEPEVLTPPFKVVDDNNDDVADLFDQSLKSVDFKLDELVSQKKGNLEEQRIQVYDAVEEYGDTADTYEDLPTDAEAFVNGVVMAKFQEKLYCQWQTSNLDEDDPYTTRVVYSVGTVSGDAVEWSEPQPLTDIQTDGGYYSSGGWYVNDNDTPNVTSDDKLVAYLNYWPADLLATDNKAVPYKGGKTFYREYNGTTWTSILPVTMYNGEQLNGIFEQDPHVLDSGRIVSAAHFQDYNNNGTPTDTSDDTTNGGLFISPVFTDDKSGTSGWFRSEFTISEFSTDSQSLEIEPSMFVNEDGSLVMIFRDQVNYPNYVWAAISTDQGVTWTTSSKTNMPNGRQKLSAGNLPDGTAYIVSCPVSEDNADDDSNTRILRYPLTITLSADGKTFTDSFVIGSTADVGSVKYAGDAKRNGYHYPKSVVIGENLYVAYARNKEIAEYVKIPLEQISIKSNGTITSSENANVGLIKLDNNKDYQSTPWDLDYNLETGTKIFVDRPSSDKLLAKELNKFFYTDKTQSSIIPNELEGAVYIRTAVEDRKLSEDIELATITASKKTTLYVGFEENGTKPDWASDFTYANIKYQATSDKWYHFWKTELNENNNFSFTFKGQPTTGGWNYIAMAVPAPDTTNDKYQYAINCIYKKLTGSDYVKLGNYGYDYNEKVDGVTDSEITLADVYMAQRFLIECANAVNDGKLELTDNSGASVEASTIYNEVYTSLKWIGEKLYNSETGLYYDGYSTADGTVSGTYDAKDIGFYAMTLVDTIAMLPDDGTTKKSELTAILKQLFDGMIKYQDSETGMWKTDITTSSDMSFEGSSMMSYALLKAYDEGILNDDNYNLAGLKAFNGIVAKELTVSATSDEVGTDETNASGIAPLMMASVYAEGMEDSINLSGKLSYSINEGETLTVEDIKKAAFVNVTPAGETTTTFDLTSPGVECVWNKTYSETPTEGTYIMTVMYNGEQVGQIPVEVKSDAAWVDVETDRLKGTYKVVHEMDPESKYGYIIARKGLGAGERNSLEANDSAKKVETRMITLESYGALETVSNGDTDGDEHDYWYSIIDINDIDKYNTWWIDKAGYLYIKVDDSSKLYLNNDLSISNTPSTVWNTKYHGKVDTVNNNVKRGAAVDIVSEEGEYLYNKSSKKDTEGEFALYPSTTTTYNNILIWTPEYAEAQASLSGTTVYNIIAGDSSVNVATIQKNARVLLREWVVDTANTTSGDNNIKFKWDLQKLDWSDTDNITFSWNHALNTDIAGVYVMTVRYKNVPIGTITVNVGEVTWTDITDYTYQRTTEIEEGKYYIITDSSLDTTIDSGSTTTTKSLATGFNTNKVKDCWSSAKDVKVTKTGDNEYSIKTNDEATLGEVYRWHVNSSKHVYTVINGRLYYLRGENAAEDNITKQISVSTDYKAAISWNAVPSGTTDKTNLTTTVDSATRYLSYTSRNLFQSIKDAATVTLYTPVSSQIKEVAMAGEKEYTVVANNNNMSETYIKAKTNFYLKTTNTDGTYTLDRILWSGEDGLTYEWSATALDGVTPLTDTSGNPITELDANTEGIYTMTVSYEGKVVGTVKVNVKEISKVDYSGKWYVSVGKGQEPDLSNEVLTVTYSDGSTEIVSIADGVSISNYDTTVVGKQTAVIEYMGYKFEEHLTIEVLDDAFAGLSDATDYPKYPEEGAVRLNKTATNDTNLPWYGTGVTKVELDVAGTSVRSGVDVILVSDISNSMGRYSDDGTELGEKLNESMKAASDLAEKLLANNNKNKNSISFVTFGGYDKDNCEESAKEGSYNYVIENPEVDGYGTLQEPVGRLDSTQTVFVYEDDLEAVKNSFKGTIFLSRKDNKGIDGVDADNDIVQITNNKGEKSIGWNSGGTNYDYAFAEAINAVAELKVAYSKANNNESYDASGRQIVLLFMTDGAPTYYNYEGVDIGITGSSNYLYGTVINYPPSKDKFYAGVSNDDSVKDDDYQINGETKKYYEWWNERSTNWYNFTNNPNEYAVELNSLVDAFYAVGFKMKEDLGKSKHCYNWDDTKFTNILAGVAGVENGKQAIDGVILAEESEALSKAYVEMTERVTSSGTYATVNDIIKWEFSLVMDDLVTDINNNATTVEPVIEIKKYDLDGNGERTGTPEILERVHFEVSEDSKITAHSNQIYETDNNGNITSYPDIIQGRDDETDTDGMFKIVGKYFTYTNANYGNYEFFDWNIQTIAGYEYALSYYVSLRGTNSNYQSSSDGSFIPGNNVYDTNTEAKITYVDINGDKAVQTFDKPKKPWGKAVTTVEYYLVDTDGNPVDRAGNPVNFDNRIRVSEATHSHEVNWNEPTTIKGELHAPAGYVMYNQAAYYTVEVNVDKYSNMTGSFNIVDTKTIAGSEEITTRRSDNNPEDNYEATIVSFGVYSSGESPLILNKDQIVIDYGKAIQVDVLENDNLTNDGTVTIDNDTFYVTLVGLADYMDNSIYTEYIQGSSGTTEPIKTSGGLFTLVNDGKSVQFKPNAMISEVQRVYAVVKLINATNSSDLFYLYQEVDVIPATVMYYETDFVSNQITSDNDIVDVFDYTKSEGGTSSDWTTLYDSGEAQKVVEPTETDDPVQNDGTIAVTPSPQTYGYDSTYSDDNLLSDGSSKFVKGGNGSAADLDTTVSFTFTGTGFDLISRTGAEHGMIQARIYDTADGSLKKTISVLNKSDSDWGELYQIPVISTELDYGTYDVKIIVFSGYNNPDYPIMYRGNEFYFDAVRIYDPMGVKETTDATALEAYKADGQAYPTIHEVRELLISAGDFDANNSTNPGLIFVEKPIWDSENGEYITSTNDRVDISNYDKIGPNNETYLDSGDFIAFKLTGINVDNLASIDIGAKSANGEATKLSVGIANANTTAPTYQISGQEIKSSTQQYYDVLSGISDLTSVVSNGEAYVFITNTGESGKILSITDIKIAYNANPEAEAQIVSDYSLVSLASSWILVEPDYDVKSAEFTIEKARIFSNATILAETTKDVEEIKVTDRFGKEVNAEISYEDFEDGSRIWSITLLMSKLGTQKYIVTGYSESGISGESASASIQVSTEEGGGWQNAKSIFKTLFNCRILSIKRSSGNKL